MLGSSLGGPSGAIAFSRDNHNEQEYNRESMKDYGIEELLVREDENYAIRYASTAM